MGSSTHIVSVLVAIITLASVVAQDPRSNLPPPATAAPGLFGLTFPTFAPLNIPTLAPLGVPCLGASSQSSGVCRKDDGECSATGGAIDGQCLGNFGQCCVPTIKCGATALTNGSFLSNNNYPKETTENTQCTITINKIGNIKQIRLELIKFHVGAPDAQGKCSDDYMMIQSGLSAGASIPRLCGKNDGQHIILPVEETKANKELTVVIRFSISGRSKSMWLIQVIQQNQLNPMLAPDNCLQYHTGPTGNMSSLSTGANLDGLRYSICFRREIDYCSIKFTLDANKALITDNATSDATDSRKRREAHGNYQPGQYVRPMQAPQHAQYVRPVQYLVPQQPAARPVQYKYPVYPLVKPGAYRPPYDSPFPQGWYPGHSTMSPATNGTSVSNIMPLEPMMSTTLASNETTNATDSPVTDRNVPVVPVVPGTPNCDGQDIVLFPPSTIVCDNVQTTPVLMPKNFNIVFVDNRGKPTHSAGWNYRFDYQSDC